MRITHFITKNENAQGALRDPHLIRTMGGMRFGEKVRQIRKAKGMTLAEVESRAGLPDGNLSRIERGKQWVTEEKIYTLAGALEVDPAAFFSGGFLEVDHFQPTERQRTLGNIALIDPDQNALHYLPDLGSDDIAEFESLIKSRQERNRKLVLELREGRMPQRQPEKIRQKDAQEAEAEGKKQSSQSSS